MTERIQHVMVVTAHPDDSEFGAGGTVAALTREGKSVTYCILTNGNKGSSDRGMTPERLVKIREEEQRNAARGLGVETIDFLGFPDCELENTPETIDLKIKALLCHVSQMKDVAAMEKRVRERNAELGKGKGFAFAETFDRVVIDR